MENKAFTIILIVSIALGLLITLESYLFIDRSGVVFIFLLHLILLAMIANMAYDIVVKAFLSIERGFILCLSLALMKSCFILYIIIQNMIFIKPEQNQGFLLVGVVLLLWAIVFTLFEALFAFIISILMPFYISNYFLKQKN